MPLLLALTERLSGYAGGGLDLAVLHAAAPSSSFVPVVPGRLLGAVQSQVPPPQKLCDGTFAPCRSVSRTMPTSKAPPPARIVIFLSKSVSNI